MGIIKSKKIIMLNKFKQYLIGKLSLLRNRWQTMNSLERKKFIKKRTIELVGSILVIWLASWYFLGPSFVSIDDIKVDLDRSISIGGVDANDNGIRDDIDKYIETLSKKKGYNKHQIKALQQHARAMQNTVMVDLKSSDSIKETDDSVMRSINCTFDIFKEEDAYIVSKKVENLTLNTKRRTLVYLKFDHALSGSVTTLPDGNTCE